MEKLTKAEVGAYLLCHDNYIILTHRRPDGDTAGCAALLCRGLRAVGKQAAILTNPQLTSRYQHLHEGLTTDCVSPNALIVSVDVAGREMLPLNGKDLPVNLLIDHHGSNPGFAERGIVEPEAAACGETVYGILMTMGVALDMAMAEALYVAVSTDTGCFRFSNTTANTLMVAAKCLEAGIDHYTLNKTLFETVSLARLRLNAYMTDHLELLEGGKIALCFIPGELEEELGITEDDMEDVSNFARNVEGVELAITFRTLSSGDTKLSVRSSPNYDAARLCMALGGGGHKAAAGATVHGDQTIARKQVVEILGEMGAL